MLKIVIVEKEQVAKDIVFAFNRILKDNFIFTYYEKITDFVKDSHVNEYDVIVMDEAYNNIRVSSALNLRKNSAVVIYSGLYSYHNLQSSYSRIFYINKKEAEKELETISEELNSRLLKHSEYFFSYNGIVLKLKYQDIYYIEKEEKNLVYHTKKGEFYERGSISSKAIDFEPYDFVRINSGILVNYEFIFKIEEDEVELHNHERLPISRSRKPKLLEYIRNKTK